MEMIECVFTPPCKFTKILEVNLSAFISYRLFHEDLCSIICNVLIQVQIQTSHFQSFQLFYLSAKSSYIPGLLG